MQYRFGFVMEQTLGQVTHDQNLRALLTRHPEVKPVWMPIAFGNVDWWSTVPGVKSNWTLRASLRARRQFQTVLQSTPLDCLFFHTPVTTLFAHDVMRRIPAVVSMDATPRNLDTVGDTYGHFPGSAAAEAVKTAMTRRTFRVAQRLITWCDWARRSLIDDYGIADERIVVIPPGVDLEQWYPRERDAASGPVRLLFVGGDFVRKGGEILLRAFSQLPAGLAELDIVTRTDVDISHARGVRVHQNLASNSPGLRQLFGRADAFVFPTLGDCLPLVIMEAMASGLPVIATDVGAIREQVVEGVTGKLIPRKDARALSAAILHLVDDRGARRQLSVAARHIAAQRFDAAQNYRRLLDVCKNVADTGLVRRSETVSA